MLTKNEKEFLSDNPDLKDYFIETYHEQEFYKFVKDEYNDFKEDCRGKKR